MPCKRLLNERRRPLLTIRTPKWVKWLHRQTVSLASASLCAVHPDVFQPPKLSVGGIDKQRTMAAGQCLLCNGCYLFSGNLLCLTDLICEAHITLKATNI